MAVATRFTELVGCQVPIQQAPMGSVSTPALAIAVADAGGVGSVTALGLTAIDVDKVLAGIAARTTGVLAANFLTGHIDREAVAAAAARARVVDFFWADPDLALIELAHRGGALACWQAVRWMRPRPLLTPAAMLLPCRASKRAGISGATVRCCPYWSQCSASLTCRYWRRVGSATAAPSPQCLAWVRPAPGWEHGS